MDRYEVAHACSHLEMREMIEHIFPELKVSEDEKIRESLLKYLHTLPNHYTHSGVCALEWIAWLEKQGDKKPEYITPKFKVGDYIIRNNEFAKPVKIVNIDDFYHVSNIEGTIFTLTINDVNDNFRLFSETVERLYGDKL